MDTGAKPIRVFLVAGHAALRQSLALLLEGEGMAICGLAADPSLALLGIAADADVVIVGLPLVTTAGLELIGRIASGPHAPRVLVLSVHEDQASTQRALAAGAKAYVPSRRAPAMLAHAVREVVAGRIWAPLPAATHCV